MPVEVLIDASSAILLCKAELFENLLRYYSVNVSKTVFKEITMAGYLGADYFDACRRQNRLTVKDIHSEEEIKVLPPLHQGEKETIILFWQGTGKFLITDDGSAARFCKSNNIPFINALLFPRILFDNQILAEKEYLKHKESIIALGRYSENIIDFAQNCSKQELTFFKPQR